MIIKRVELAAKIKEIRDQQKAIADSEYDLSKLYFSLKEYAGIGGGLGSHDKDSQKKVMDSAINILADMAIDNLDGIELVD